MHDEQVDVLAKVLWEYLQLHENPAKSDVILCLCSHDVRVAERAAELALRGYAPLLVFSGGTGKLTQTMFTKPEAEVFSEVAIKMGVPAEKILTESKSTNTGENILFSYRILKDAGVDMLSILLVQKPYMERRTYATFKKQWPDKKTTIKVTSPQLSYNEYIKGSIPIEQVINVMVGDMQRIRDYPKLGYQISQNIPEEVLDAYKKLVKLGYDKHLIEV